MPLCTVGERIGCGATKACAAAKQASIFASTNFRASVDEMQGEVKKRGSVCEWKKEEEEESSSCEWGDGR